MCLYYSRRLVWASYPGLQERRTSFYGENTVNRFTALSLA